jgi:hypothetical protein
VTAPKLTAFDTYGRVFLRGLLAEPVTVETLDAARALLEAGGAGYSLEDVAAEVGVRLPVAPISAATPRRIRTARKSRSR